MACTLLLSRLIELRPAVLFPRSSTDPACAPAMVFAWPLENPWEETATISNCPICSLWLSDEARAAQVRGAVGAAASNSS